MSVARAVRLFGLTLAAVVLVASGTYLLVYLYRWEWKRAQISGTFFLAALVALATAQILSRLSRIERRLDQRDAEQDRGPVWSDPSVAPPPSVDTVRRANAEHARRHFDWLRKSSDRLGVFVPFLIGAGIILSVLAYVIERVAGLFAGPGMDRRIAAMLGPQLPLGSGRGLDEVVADSGSAIHRPRVGRIVLAVVVVAALVTGTVFIVRESTQARSEPEQISASTTVELEVAQRGPPQPAEEVAEALSIACRSQLPRDASVEVLDDEAGDGDESRAAEPELVEATLVVDRGMGPQRRRRFFGCLEDATLDRAIATVTRFDVIAPQG